MAKSIYGAEIFLISLACWTCFMIAIRFWTQNSPPIFKGELALLVALQGASS